MNGVGGGGAGHVVWSLATRKPGALLSWGLPVAAAGPRGAGKRVKQERTIEEPCLADLTVLSMGCA